MNILSFYRLSLSIIAGVILGLGWEVNINEVGFFQFMLVWIVGSLILTEVVPCFNEKDQTK